MIPVFFGLTLILIGWIYYQKAHSDHAIKQAQDAFWDKETRANTTRKKDISNLDYITVPVDTLLVGYRSMDTSDNIPLQELAAAEEKIADLGTRKIVNFTGITNTDLKLTYGAPNIDLLSEFDQNYLELVRTLYRYGKLLYENGNRTAAKTVLRFGVDIGTDVSANYTLLAQIYKAENASGDIDFLITSAEKLHSMTKESLLASLMAIRDSSVLP